MFSRCSVWSSVWSFTCSTGVTGDWLTFCLLELQVIDSRSVYWSYRWLTHALSTGVTGDWLTLCLLELQVIDSRSVYWSYRWLTHVLSKLYWSYRWLTHVFGSRSHKLYWYYSFFTESTVVDYYITPTALTTWGFQGVAYIEWEETTDGLYEVRRFVRDYLTYVWII